MKKAKQSFMVWFDLFKTWMIYLIRLQILLVEELKERKKIEAINKIEVQAYPHMYMLG